MESTQDQLAMELEQLKRLEEENRVAGDHH